MALAKDFAPRLMPAPQAAHYIGVSVTKLRELPIPRKILDGKRLYDRLDLDSYADGLATEGEVENGGW
ncbi:DNA-binding protein [Salipiger manganoxidans]|uniref:DNA-binding protein n=1 Tax=Salipiger marinus TaxID=555512 RepID=UPI001E283964|nr:DNA-binding protein [Salipiger manganoxidans]MCD1616944.1 DNA-binding protein [Salipiger manganoxidans]